MRQVIYAWNYLEWGGAQIHFLALAKIVREELDPLFIFPEGTSEQFAAFLNDANIPYELFQGHADMAPAPTISRKLKIHWQKIKSEFALLRHLNKLDLKNSIVHTDLSPSHSLTALVWLCLQTRVFITAHNKLSDAPIWRRSLWKLKFSIISGFSTFHVFCSNENARSYFEKLYSRKIGEQIKVTYTSVNPAEIEDAIATVDVDREVLRKRFNLPLDKFIVLAVGQFIDRKGRWPFLEAAEKLIPQNPDIAFVWLAPNKPNEEDQRRIDNLDLDGRFRLILSETVGSRADILRFFAIADVFALPSYVEGLPIALLEAMALKKPSISTNVYAIPEAVKNNETGILIEAGDSKALAEAIMLLKNDKNMRERLAEKGSKYVLHHFNDLSVAGVALAAYKECFADALFAKARA